VSNLMEMETRFGVSRLDHLDKSADIPTVSRLAFQGDVAVVCAALAGRTLRNATTPIPAAGYPVVRGENGGNTHALFGSGFFDPASPGAGELGLGVLTVPAGQQVLLSHPEHGGLLVEPGTYQLRRQREQLDDIALVAD
jgi:hypothetical protein